MTLKHPFPILAVASILVGCSTGAQPYATGEIAQATDNAKIVRGIYDSNKGEYDKVSATDKAKLIEIYKSDAGARKAFDLIKHPPGGMGGSSNPPQALGK